MKPLFVVLVLLLGMAVPAPAATKPPRVIMASGCPERCDDNGEPGRDAELVLMTNDGTRMKFLTDNTSFDYDGRWSPDEDRIAFTCRGTFHRERTNEICVMDAVGSDRRRLTSNDENDSEPDWSPDGEWIVFTRHNYPEYDLYKMRANGSDVTQLTDIPGGELNPSWSPDGSRIIFTHWGTQAGDIPETTWIMDADGSNQRQFAKGDETQHDPEWSPDGTRVAVTQYYDGSGENYHGWQITLMDADGTHLRRVTDGGGNHMPHWSSNGKWIVYYRNGPMYRIRPDGSDQTKVYDGRRKYIASDWRSR